MNYFGLWTSPRVTMVEIGGKNSGFFFGVNLGIFTLIILRVIPVQITGSSGV